MSIFIFFHGHISKTSFQPARCIVYVVPESPEVYTVYCLAQLQMVHFEDSSVLRFNVDDSSVLLLRTWLLSEKDDGSLKELK